MNTQFDKLVDRFEVELRAGKSPRIEDYLEHVTGPAGDTALFELISLEVYYRKKQGLEVCGADYVRFGAPATKHAEQVIAASDIEAELDLPKDQLDGYSRTVDRYLLLEQIGEGGMGTVWKAVQQEPVKRHVALKLIKPELASSEFVARFEVERQALALMDHNHIAKVLDAGTTDGGRPYFVMELVDGIPISRYCDDNQLSIEQRLKLFLPVCKAVQHAHQKGVLHRDLKPTNVLVSVVDEEPVPKVIDFGLAKAAQQNLKLTDKTMLTEYGKVVGTLQYMSPEQAEMDGRDVDARSDVYSLGVMLYELLTGSTPVDKQTLGTRPFLKVLEIIREKDPPRPSERLSSSSIQVVKHLSEARKINAAKLQQILKGELDWVVMKALEKEGSRRYQTASELADDISNFLSGSPIKARPPSMWYQSRKFATRNRGLLTSLVTIFLVGVAGIAGTTYGLMRANQKSVESGANGQLGASVSTANSEDSSLVSDSSNRRPAESSAETNGDREEAGQGRRFRFERNEITCSGHQSWVHRVAFSPDSSQVASASRDATIKLWNAKSGNEIATLTGHGKPVGTVAYSPDGKWLASASYDQTIKIWDAKTFQEKLTIVGHRKLVAEIQFSPDGAYLASASDDMTIKLWDAETGRELRTFEGHSGEVSRVVFSPDGKRIATASSDKTARLWDLESGDERMVLRGHDRGVGGIAFSPLGNLIATASDNTIKLWNANKGKEVATLIGHAHWIHNLSFNADGSLLASASGDRTIGIWDVRSGEVLTTLAGHTHEVGSVAFSPDGTCLASAGFDGTVKLWPISAEK